MIRIYNNYFRQISKNHINYITYNYVYINYPIVYITYCLVYIYI